MKLYVKSSVEQEFISNDLMPKHADLSKISAMFPIAKLSRRQGDPVDAFYIGLFRSIDEYKDWIVADFGRSDTSSSPAKELDDDYTASSLDTTVNRICEENSNCPVVYVEEDGWGPGYAFFNPYSTTIK